MKRYVPMAAIILFILAVFVWSEQVWEQKQQEEAQAAYEAERHLLVYSDLPDDVNQQIAAVFHQQTGLRVQIQTRTDSAMRDLWKTDGGQPEPDILIASEPVLRQQNQHGILQPYVSPLTETVPASQKDENGAWTGLWINPMVFIVSRDYYEQHGLAIQNWDDLLRDPAMTIAFPDLASMDMAGDFLCSLVEMKGEAAVGLYLRSLQRHVSVYSKSMAANVRRVASGETNAGVVDAAMARQYRHDGAPIYILYPQDGTSYWLTGAAVMAWCHDEELARIFMDWLFSADVDAVLRKNHLYLTYTSNGAQKILDSRGQQLVLFPVQKQYTDEGRRALQDWWIKSVRFGKEP